MIHPLFKSALNLRKPTYEVNPLFIERWSPRAIKSEPIPKNTLMSLFEAARWAPSSYNNQPWRFIYSLKGTPQWESFFSLLHNGNKEWAKKAPVLVLIVSNKAFEKTGDPSKTHSFDTGSAWMSLALQAVEIGLVAHAMEGFDYEKAKETARIPDSFQVEAMVAIGYPDKATSLNENYRKMESPSSRKPVSEIAFEGLFQS